MSLYDTELSSFMWKIQHGVSDLIQTEKKIDEINNLVELSHDENSVFQFSDKYLKEAYDNVESYVILYCLENDLRDKIRDCLADEPNWIDDSVFDKLKKDIQERKTRESKAKILMRDDDNLVYMTLGELKEVILQKWNKFEQSGVFRSKSYIDRILTDINKSRIIIAHNCKLQDLDKEQLNLNLKYYNSQS